jgi:hypothetical protein
MTSWFLEVAYPNELPSGVIERGMASEIVLVIRDRAGGVSEAFRFPKMRDDSGYATSAWERTLRIAGVECRTVGGAGQHEPTVPATPLAEVSGYRTNDDGIVRHFWLLVGPHEHLSTPRHINSTVAAGSARTGTGWGGRPYRPTDQTRPSG